MDKDVLNQGVFFALQKPANVSNPYPFYRRLRSADPFYWDFVSCGWFLTRYADVRLALADPRLSTRNFSFDVTQLPSRLQAELTPLVRVMQKGVLYNDAVEHSRLRRPLNRAFSPAVFERLRSKMECLADALLAKAERSEAMDVRADYSQPLADFMMGELLGLPEADRVQFLGWCDQLRTFVTGERMSLETLSRVKGAAQSFERIRDYVRLMIASRREQFVDDVIGHAFAVEKQEAPLTEDEVLANCIFSCMRVHVTWPLRSRIPCSRCCDIQKSSPGSVAILPCFLSPWKSCFATTPPFRWRSAVFPTKSNSPAGALVQINCSCS